MAETVTLSLTATRYKGTSVDTQVAGDHVGNVYLNGAEYYRMQLTFKSAKRLKKLTLRLGYSTGENESRVEYRCGVYDSCPAQSYTGGKSFVWSDKAAAVTLEQTFEANTEYSVWVWSPSSTRGYVVLSGYTAEGAVAAPALYAKTAGGWVECEGLQAKTAAGWREAEGLQAKAGSGWQET